MTTRFALWLLLLTPTLARADNAPCSELAKSIDLRDAPNDDRRVICQFAKDMVAGGCCQSTLYNCLLKNPSCARGQVLSDVGRFVIAGGGTEEKAVAAATAYEDSFAHGKREKIDLAGVPCKGPAKGVTLVEFSDFDCPHCALTAPLVEKVAKAFPQIRICSLAFPLPMHKYSRLAAAAALYADSKGKYWQMSTLLFQRQAEREDVSASEYREALLKAGESLGLPRLGLTDALEPGPYLQRVDAQAAQAKDLKLDGTPYFFLDGRSLKEVPLGSLGVAVEDQLTSKATN